MDKMFESKTIASGHPQEQFVFSEKLNFKKLQNQIPFSLNKVEEQIMNLLAANQFDEAGKILHKEFFKSSVSEAVLFFQACLNIDQGQKTQGLELIAQLAQKESGYQNLFEDISLAPEVFTETLRSERLLNLQSFENEFYKKLNQDIVKTAQLKKIKTDSELAVFIDEHSQTLLQGYHLYHALKNNYQDQSRVHYNLVIIASALKKYSDVINLSLPIQTDSIYYASSLLHQGKAFLAQNLLSEAEHSYLEGFKIAEQQKDILLQNTLEVNLVHVRLIKNLQESKQTRENIAHQLKHYLVENFQSETLNEFEKDRVSQYFEENAWPEIYELIKQMYYFVQNPHRQPI